MRLIIMIGTFLLMLEADVWQLAKEKNAVTVYTRAIEGSSFLEFKGETVVEGSVDALVALLYDTANAPAWIHDCSFAMTLKEVSFEENYVFQIYDLPFPVSNRQLILHSKLTYTEEGARLETKEVNTFCKDKQLRRCQKVNENTLIQIKRSRGHYIFIRLDDKRTKVVWQQHIEPGGSVPDWLVNALVVDIPYHSLLRLQELVKDQKYRDMTKRKLENRWLEQYRSFY